MKGKLKYLLTALAFVLVFSGAIKASAADAYKILAADCSADYTEELLTVTVPKANVVYYQVTKTDAATVKADAWIEVVATEVSGENLEYIIDFSAISNTKTGYIALTTDPTVTTGQLSFALTARVKSFKTTLDFAQEEVAQTNGLYDILKTINVKGVTTTDDKVLPEENLKINEYYKIGWKKGSNGSWKKATAFDTNTWNAMKAANATLYLRIEAIDSNADKDLADDADFIRTSKEVKVKIAKVAKAPKVKIDFEKGTLAIKNGMEFFVKDKWVKVLPYNKNSANTYETSAMNYDGTNKGTDTKVKVSTLNVNDFVKALQTVDGSIKDGDAVSVKVRTSATEKKFASLTTLVAIKTPAAAPTADDNAGTKAYVYTAAIAGNTTATPTVAPVPASLKLDPSVVLASGTITDYEYVLCTKADSAAVAACSKNKWTTFESASVVDLSSKVGKEVKYYVAEKTTKEVKYEAVDCILVRAKAKEATDSTEGVFASKIVTIEVNKATTTTEEPEEPSSYSVKVTSDAGATADGDNFVINLANGYTGPSAVTFTITGVGTGSYNNLTVALDAETVVKITTVLSGNTITNTGTATFSITPEASLAGDNNVANVTIKDGSTTVKTFTITVKVAAE